MNLEEKISGNKAAVEPELYFNELTDPSHSAKFEYLIKESKSYISHAVNVSELRLTKLGREGEEREATTDQWPSLTIAGVSSFARVLNPEYLHTRAFAQSRLFHGQVPSLNVNLHVRDN